MGQPISPEMRSRIAALDAVREVTSQHIITRRGVPIDPADFIVASKPTRFIFKLLQCRCWFRKHPAGLHKLVHGATLEYADGKTKHNYRLPDLCPNGRWTLEEVLAGMSVTIKGVRTSPT